MSVRRISISAFALVIIGVGAFFATRQHLFPKPPEKAAPTSSDDRVEIKNMSVTTTHPQLGALERIAVVPGSIQSYEHVNLFSKVSGYLKKQTVDIGDHVKEGQLLAEIDIPEMDKMVQRNKAVLEQAQAKVDQMKARIATAKADLKAAEANVIQTEATAKSAGAWLRFREKQLNRMKELFGLKAIDERLVDEAQERFEAAVETERSAKASINTAHAQVAAMEAKVLQAQSDERAADAEVRVAQAELERSVIQQSFAFLRAPFDGIITHRSLFPGDYVRAANEGSPPSLLTLQRVSRMRVILEIPDRDVPFADIGDTAVVQIDAFPDDRIPAKISRISGTEDPQTRLMRVEIDLPNPMGKIRQGMYGKVTIVLDKVANQLSIPSNCLSGRTQQGKGTVFVIRDGKAHLADVLLGIDNGLRVGIVKGLTADAVVIVSPPANLVEGTEVVPMATH